MYMAVMNIRHMVMSVNFKVVLVLMAMFFTVCNILHLMHMLMVLVGMRVKMVVFCHFMSMKMFMRFSKQQKYPCQDKRERDKELHCRGIFAY